MSSEAGLPVGNVLMHFEVHPSVLFKLGEDLISDDAQALVELIKNSYDADAHVVRVEIDTESWFDRRTGRPVDARSRGAVRGRLSVRDDGTGMDLDSIRDGWLTVSSSHKRRMKAAGVKTSANRTPLGDKGLGRLGVQRLGEVVELISVPSAASKGDARYRILIDWSSFTSAESLAAVSLPVETEEGELRPRGT